MVPVRSSLTAASEKICSMKEPIDLHALAVKLCGGQSVFFEGHVIGATIIPFEEWSCYWCSMSDICNMRILDLCAECDAYEHKKHRLYLDEL